MAGNSSEKQNTDLRVGLLTGVFALLGGIISAGIGSIAAIQTSSETSHQSCIVRIDAREAVILAKADAFFTAQGSLISLMSHRNIGDEELEKRIDAVVVTAYSLSSFLDDENYETPRLFALDLLEKFSAHKSEEDKKNMQKIDRDIIQHLNKMNDQYRHLIVEFESTRKQC